MPRNQEISALKVFDLLVNSALVLKLMAGYQEAGRRLERARLFAAAAGNESAELKAVSEAAALCYIWGRLDQGLAFVEQVLKCEGNAFEESRASAWNTAGNINLRRCDFEAAEACFLKALERYRLLGREISMGIILNNLANIGNVRGDYDKALDLYRQALGTFEKYRDSFRIAHVLHSISQILLSQHDYAGAKSGLLRSLELRQRMQDHRGVANSLLVLVGLETDLKDFGAAREHLRQVDETLETHGMGEPHLIAYRQGTAGILHFNAGGLDEAEACFLKLIGISEQGGFAEFLAGGWNWLGKTRVHRDRTPAGLDDIRKGIGLAEAGKLPYELKNGWGYMAECLMLLGDREGAAQAAALYREAALNQGLPADEVERNVGALLAGRG